MEIVKTGKELINLLTNMYLASSCGSFTIFTADSSDQ